MLIFKKKIPLRRCLREFAAPFKVTYQKGNLPEGLVWYAESKELAGCGVTLLVKSVPKSKEKIEDRIPKNCLSTQVHGR